MKRLSLRKTAYFLSLVMCVGIFATDTNDNKLYAKENPTCVMDYASTEEEQSDEQTDDMYVDDIDVVAAYYTNLYITGTNKYSLAYDVLDLLNAERKAAGLETLIMDVDMLELAMLRAAECNVCYGHSRPSGEFYYAPFLELPAVNGYCGENIAMGQSGPASVMESWMTSEGHRENILNADYTSVGIGCFKQNNGSYCWVQVFGAGTPTEVAKQADRTMIHDIQIMTSYLFKTDFYAPDICVDEGKQVKPVLTMSNQGTGLDSNQAAYFGANINLDSFDWTSDDSTVATVAGDGTVTGVNSGDFTITGRTTTAPNLEIVISGTVLDVDDGTGETPGSTGGTQEDVGETPGSTGGAGDGAGDTSGSTDDTEETPGSTEGAGDGAGDTSGSTDDTEETPGSTGGAGDGAGDTSGSTDDTEGTPGNNNGVWFADYQGCEFYKYSDGNVRAFYKNDNKPVIDEFKCDGVYTYYFQYDGTAMKDRLTYHPDGVHIIYFDSKGHEVFSNFANVKKSIEGNVVDDLCFFDVYGYMYVDVVTYDQAGINLYYANPCGVMECSGWFEFSAKQGGGYGYASSDGKLMCNQYTYDWNGNLVYMDADGSMRGSR